MLRSLAASCSWVLLLLSADGASANKWVFKKFHAAFKSHGVLVLELICGIHGLYGCVRFVLGIGDHIAPMFCAGNLLAQSEYHTRLLTALAELLIDGMGFQRVAKAELCAEQDDGGLQAMLDRCLHRKDFYHNATKDLLNDDAYNKLFKEREPQKQKELELANRIRKLFFWTAQETSLCWLLRRPLGFHIAVTCSDKNFPA